MHYFARSRKRRDASRSEIYSAALTRRKTIPRCAARYMVSHWCVFSRMERDDCALATPIRYELVCASGLPWWSENRNGGSRGVARWAVLRPFLAFVRREIAARYFFLACTATRFIGWIHVTFAMRQDAMHRAARRRPDFKLLDIRDRYELATLHSFKANQSSF